MSDQSPGRAFQFVVRLGDLRKPLVPGEPFTIGKETTSSLRLGHGTVSPTHCRLEVTDQQVIVHDLNSLCGTRVDGQPLMDGPWPPGSILEVGDIRIELETEAMEPAPAGAIPTTLVSHRQEVTFGTIMAAELKRAPWFAISVVAHAIVLLLLWVFYERPIPMGVDGRTFALQESEEPRTYAEEEIHEEPVEIEESRDEAFQETEAQEEEMFFEEVEAAVAETGPADVDDLMTKVGTGIDDILRAGQSAISGKFKKTVAGLRKDGLEIVFVFDSTGSMGDVLQAAKNRIEKTVSVIHELVPYARIGVITYRDTGPGEAYLTKEVALSRDFYRSINFLKLIEAAGGDTEPEAVHEALLAAVAQKWGSTARRLVVLIGDAPPHPETENEITRTVRGFARDGRSFVHAIITQPPNSGITESTRRTFRRIALEGRGQALEFADEGKILEAVLSLAFGRRESRSLEEVYRLADGRSKQASPRSRRLVESGNVQQLRRELSRPVIDHDLVKAILLAPTKAVLYELANIVTERDFNDPGKHAAAYVLTRVLGLSEAPVDPESSKAFPRNRVRTLQRAIERRLR